MHFDVYVATREDAVGTCGYRHTTRVDVRNGTYGRPPQLMCYIRFDTGRCMMVWYLLPQWLWDEHTRICN